MIFKRQQRRINDLLRNHPDQSPEFQSEARETLEREARAYNEKHNVVGYKRPPRHTQFKKGSPGGPGRPKGDALYRKVIEMISRNNASVLEEIVQGILDRALKGEPRAIRTLVYLVENKRK